MTKFLALMLLALVAISMFQAIAAEAAYQTNTRGGHGRGGGGGHGYGPGSLRIFQCPGQCTRRCSQTQYHKPCMFFCQKCCRKCLCVPPGFYGNKAVCPCYNNWKTQQGGPKCP